MWFHTYAGNVKGFAPEKGEFTGMFKVQVQDVRTWFDTKKLPATPGAIPPEASKVYREYVFDNDETLRNTQVFVNLAQFSWYEFRYVSKYGYWTPVFRLRVCITKPDSRGNPIQVIDDTPQGRKYKVARVAPVYFDHELLMEFPPNYWNQSPSFKVNDSKYLNLSQSHDHHMRFGDFASREGTVLCIMAEASDWKPGKSTSASAVNAALLWCVWHFEKFGDRWNDRSYTANWGTPWDR